MKRILSAVISIIFALSLSAAFAMPDETLSDEDFVVTIETAEELDMTQSKQITVTATDADTEVNYVMLSVNGKEIGCQRGNDGVYTFDYVFDAVGEYTITATAVDNMDRTAQATKKVKVYKNIIEEKGLIDINLIPVIVAPTAIIGRAIIT